MITPNLNEFKHISLLEKLNAQKSGTLVIWEKIDSIQKENYYEELNLLREHLALVFHRFLDGSIRGRKILLDLNNNLIKGFNPFNESNTATQTLLNN